MHLMREGELNMRTNLTEWAPISGIWKLDGSTATYLGPDPSDPSSSQFGYGVALSPTRLRGGSITTMVFLEETEESAGRIVFGYNSATGNYLSAGIAGYGFAYLLDEFLPNRGWRAVRREGSKLNLHPQTPYELEVRLQGQRVSLTVNNVKVIEQNLPYPPSGDQIGLFAWGPGGVRFENTAAKGAKPQAFVVMQFGEPFDSLYSEVIKPVAENMDFDAYRADDVYKPGIILQDIIRGILEAEVVVAEITSMNANVFYELGYAHALGKPTILLAERNHELPFDIKSYRCIFYDNTIRGKTDVETSLRKHLSNIRDGA